MVIAGASGLIGRRLVAATKTHWNVTVLTRTVDGSEPAGVTAVAWNPCAARDGDEAALDTLAGVLDGADVLVNLAGASIADGRFGAEHRRRILDSRIDATRTLVEAAKRTEHAPATWLQASASGIYGDRGDEVLDEASPPADDFLAQVGVAWEAAAAPAAERSRLVIGRIGVVFAPEAKAWQQLLLPIRLFAGGPLGSGRQWWPWVHADDLVRAMLFLVGTRKADAVNGETRAEGAYVLTAPEPARQIDIARAAARELRRPVWLPAPAFALRIVLGGLADYLLLPSTRAVPKRLLDAGFTFHYPTIDEAAAGLISGVSAPTPR